MPVKGTHLTFPVLGPVLPEEEEEVVHPLVHQCGVSPQAQQVPGDQVGCRGRPGAGSGARVTWVCWRCTGLVTNTETNLI